MLPSKNVLTGFVLLLKKVVISNHQASEFKGTEMHALLEHYPQNALEKH